MPFRHTARPQRWRICKECPKRGIKVIIAGANGCPSSRSDCAMTPLPVIGVPIKASLGGLDAILSILQMPRESRWPQWLWTAPWMQPFLPCRWWPRAMERWCRKLWITAWKKLWKRTTSWKWNTSLNDSFQINKRTELKWSILRMTYFPEMGFYALLSGIFNVSQQWKTILPVRASAFPCFRFICRFVGSISQPGRIAGWMNFPQDSLWIAVYIDLLSLSAGSVALPAGNGTLESVFSSESNHSRKIIWLAYAMSLRKMERPDWLPQQYFPETNGTKACNIWSGRDLQAFWKTASWRTSFQSGEGGIDALPESRRWCAGGVPFQRFGSGSFWNGKDNKNRRLQSRTGIFTRPKPASAHPGGLSNIPQDLAIKPEKFQQISDLATMPI